MPTFCTAEEFKNLIPCFIMSNFPGQPLVVVPSVPAFQIPFVPEWKIDKRTIIMNILAIADIIEKIKSVMVNLIEKVKEFASGSMWWLALIIFIVAAILMLVGLIRFIVKGWKLFLVLIILAAIGITVWYFVAGPGKKPASTESILLPIKLARNIFGF